MQLNHGVKSLLFDCYKSIRDTKKKWVNNNLYNYIKLTYKFKDYKKNPINFNKYI